MIFLNRAGRVKSPFGVDRDLFKGPSDSGDTSAHAPVQRDADRGAAAGPQANGCLRPSSQAPGGASIWGL